MADVSVGVRFFGRLPWLLANPVRHDGALTALHNRLTRRKEDFLTLIKSEVYESRHSPYLRLLKEAGCTYGDLEHQVRTNGLEPTLHALFREDVYLTADEFKGRQVIKRGSVQLDTSPASFSNSNSSTHLLSESGGSRGARTPVGLDLRSIRDQAEGLRLFLDVLGGTRWRHAVWGVPGSSSMQILLRFAVAGCPPTRWFSQISADFMSA